MKTKEEIIGDRDKAIRDARYILQNPYFILDTETTGLTNAQMCQIAILKSDGTQFKSLVKPTIHIEPGASNVHHITDADVINSPGAHEVLRHIPIFGYLVAYNTPFDLKILQQSLKAQGHVYNIEFHSGIYDMMQIYSAFRGIWDDYHGNYKWFKLGDACEQCGIAMDLELHDAMSDVIMTERLLKYVAEQKLSTEELSFDEQNEGHPSNYGDS
jgi:DNA polymerase-3 subunit epsilon